MRESVGAVPGREPGAVETVDVAGLRIAFRRAGSGPPVVLLHGAFADGRAWRRQLQAIAQDFTVVAWDTPGWGQSDDPPETAGERDYADYLAAFVREVGLERPHVVGHSFGGILALAIYRRHPELPASLVLASTYAGWAGSLPPEIVEERVQQALRDADRPRDEVVAAYLAGLFTEEARPELIAETVEIMSDFRPAGVRAIARAFGRADLSDVLPRISVPTLLVWGEEDRRSPLSIARQFHETIPGSRLVVVPAAGHEVALEAPQAFNAAVLRFLGSVRA